MNDKAALFAVAGIALYAAHHVGDYWVQTDHQARHKGDAGHYGRVQCLMHCLTYLVTQNLMLGCALIVLNVSCSPAGWVSGLAVSGVTHYLADRRAYGLMFRLARLIPGSDDLLVLGVPRRLMVRTQSAESMSYTEVPVDNPSLGTGAWALDQAWHIFWGVFVAALLVAAL